VRATSAVSSADFAAENLRVKLASEKNFVNLGA
jgi:hypothetical protein